MERRTVYLVGPTQRAYAKRLIDEAPDDYVVRIKAPTRSDIQNDKMWAMCEDLARQAVWPTNGRRLTKDGWKDAGVALSRQMRGLEQDSVPSPEGGFLIIGGGSSRLTVSEFSHLIETLYMIGDQQGVRWSEPPQKDVAA